MRSGSASSIYVHTNPVGSSYYNNLQYSCNGGPTFDYHIPKVYVNGDIYFRTACQLDPINELVKMAIDNNIECGNFSG